MNKHFKSILIGTIYALTISVGAQIVVGPGSGGGGSSGAAQWGLITGTLSDQTDLQTALDAKLTTSTLGAGVATWLGTPSSANLASAVTGETGSGALVFGTSPTIASPTVTGTCLGCASENIGFTIDGAGLAITTGFKGCVPSPITGTIFSATLLSTDSAGPATSGSIVIDVWKDTFANYPPTVADSITASAKPTLSAANKSQDTTLTGWTTSVTQGNIFCFNVDSASTVTRVTLQLRVQ